MQVSIDQKIAQKEMELARLKEQKRSLANGQKIIVGSIVMRQMRKNEAFRKELVSLLSKELTRDVDRKRLMLFLVEMGYQEANS